MEERRLLEYKNPYTGFEIKNPYTPFGQSIGWGIIVSGWFNLSANRGTYPPGYPTESRIHTRLARSTIICELTKPAKVC